MAAGLFTMGIGALILAIVQGQSWSWGGARVIGLFTVAAVLSAVVVFRCARHPVPLVDPVIIRTRAIALANLAALTLFIAFATLLLGGVLFQTEVWRVSVMTAGLQLAPGPLTTAILAVPGAVLGERLGHRYVGAAGAVLFGLGGLWLLTHLERTPDYASDMLPASLIGGAGIGLIMPSLGAAATAPLPPARLATGTAVLGMTRQVGAALGVALFVAILGEPTPATAVEAFRGAWTLLIASCLACAAALLAVGPVHVGTAGDATTDVGADGAALGGAYPPPLRVGVERR